MREKRSQGLRGSLVLTLLTAVVLFLGFVALARTSGATEERRGRGPAQQGSDPAALMTQGKLAVDLGDYEAASEAFSSVVGDESAPDALRWEALVRLGLARLAAGDFQGGADAFKNVTADYSDDPDAIRFLISAVASAGQGKIWLDLKPEFEELLRSADVASVEELGVGVVGLKRVFLTAGDIELSAVFRPATPGRSPADNGLYEVAAYEMDKLLGLDMVPPAVERIITDEHAFQTPEELTEFLATAEVVFAPDGMSFVATDEQGSLQLWAIDHPRATRSSPEFPWPTGEQGSLQLWVEGVMPVQGLEARAPADWAHQRSRIATFDNLIDNRDRNLGNILIAPGWGVVLIDHTRCFGSDTELEGPPDQFDRRLVEKLRALDREVLQDRLGGLLSSEQIDGILGRRDALLDHVDKLIAELGVARVLF